uniref:protein-synthesizing GTPase n=1 Tax=Timema monikensis TaxID=170555 RepID=A0A7R9E414_9NEOP|nr:unnamed protein product [Timema monikensis]
MCNECLHRIGDVTKLTALSPEVISRQATINIGTIGHVAHGKSTVVKAISGVQTVRFKNELERNITIKLGECKLVLIFKTNNVKKRKSIIEQAPSWKKRSGQAASSSKKNKNSSGKCAVNQEEEIYEVDKIVDHGVFDDGREYFLVKWKGWGSNTNTWEPESNLPGCEEILLRYFKKKQLASVREEPSREKLETFYSKIYNPSREALENLMKDFWSSKGGLVYDIPTKEKIDEVLVTLWNIAEDVRPVILIEYVKKLLLSCDLHLYRLQQRKDLDIWEQDMNNTSKDKAKIFVENEVDLEGPPDNFTYVNNYVPGEGVHIPEDPVIGCNCGEECSPGSKCCATKEWESRFAYTPDRRLNVNVGTPIYECNKCCKCPSNCRNRVVQNGRLVDLAIFRTKNGCGWGVKAMQMIRKGTFVCEYVGEVITNEEAEKRGMIYDAEGRTYLFDLDYNEKTQCPYTVDAARFGNVSHFINHSCDPNLAVYAVWINCLDRDLPRLGLFATRMIRKGEEISFDYLCTYSEKENPIAADKSKLDNDTLSDIDDRPTTPNCQIDSEKAFTPFSSPSRSRLALPSKEDEEGNLPDDIVLNTSSRRMLCKCGYANAKIYKCDNDKCPRPACYISGGSSKDDSFPCLRPNCTGRFKLIRHVSFVDCPGHDILMATMLNGAAVMDAALLLIAGNESCPQPQTSEHLAAIEIMKLKHILILQNKIDLVKEGQAKEQYEQILKFVQGTVAEGVPVVPISAQLKYNIEVLCEYISKKIPVPLRDFTSAPRLIVIRSFDVNKPGCEVEDLKGGVAGGSILRGVLKVGMEIEVRPGLVSKDSEGKLTCRPIFSRIVSLFAEQNELQYAVPGGLIGVGTKIEPTLCRADRLVGQVLGAVGALPQIFIELEISYYLLKRLLGVRMEGDKKGAKVQKLSKNEVLLVNIGSLSTGGRVLATKADLAKISLTNPVCTEIGEKIALSRRVEKHWRWVKTL